MEARGIMDDFHIHFTLGATMIQEASVPAKWQLKLSTYLLRALPALHGFY